MNRSFQVWLACFTIFMAPFEVNARVAPLANQAPSALQIEPATLPNGEAGESYYLPGLFVNPTITVTGGTGVVSLTVTSGYLPPGLMVNRVYGDDTHFVVGYEPTTPGMFTFTLTAQDAVGQTASREYSIRISPASSLQMWQIASSGDHTCGYATFGRKWCWGFNSFGQLGNEVTDNSSFPARGLATGYLDHDWDAAVGYEHTCVNYFHRGQAISVYCEGRNQFGQLLAPSHYGEIKMTARLNHTCGIWGGALDCWGWNAYGQLGNGTYINTNEYSITQVAGLTSGVTQVALGDFHTCALVNGAVKCWGSNERGQLGIGSVGGSVNIPVLVDGLPDGIASIAAGTSHTCAITSSGEAWCWGNNDHGQLGDGTTTDRVLPVQVMSLGRRVLSMAAGAEHTCAWLDTSKVKCWGGGERGQLGNGTWADSLTPVQVSLSNSFHVAQITSGGSHMCARSTGGNVSCWGWNYAGQLGNGTFDNANIPIAVAGMANNDDLMFKLFFPVLMK